jgi:hypothetical protein
MTKQQLFLNLAFTVFLTPFLAQAQIEDKTKNKKEVKADSLPQVLEMTMVIFRDSTWGKGGLNTRMDTTVSKNGKIEKVFKPLNINTAKYDDLICEFYDANATILVREIISNPLQNHQQEAHFSLKIQKELNAVKLEIRRVRSDKKTEKLGSFKLVHVSHQ